MNDDAERLAEDVQRAVESRPALSDMDGDETVTVDLRWFDHPRRDAEGFAMSLVFGAESAEWHEYAEAHVAPKLDMRTVGEGTTTIGTLTLRADGTVADHTLKAEHTKPSER